MNARKPNFLDSPCPMPEEFHEWANKFEDFKEEAREAINKVHDMHATIGRMIQHTAHLPKLDNISDSLEVMSSNLLSAATGREHTDNRTVKLIVYILGGVIAVLITIIGFILTGQRFGILPIPH